MKLNRKITGALLAAAIAGSFCIGGTMAYLTDSENVTNEFTVGKVDIELEEPSFNPEENDKIEPSQEIKKDPMIKNTGINDAYVYLEVRIPVKDVITANAAGKRNPASATELFTFQAKENWTLMDSRTEGTDKVYVYCYNSILKKGQTTDSLFDTVTFANVIEGQLDGAKLNIPVHAYAIQTVNTGDNKSTVPEQAKAAYSKYVNQNTSAAN